MGAITTKWKVFHVWEEGEAKVNKGEGWEYVLGRYCRGSHDLGKSALLI